MIHWITDHPWVPTGGWEVTDGPCLWCREPKTRHTRAVSPPTARDKLIPIMFWGSAFDPMSARRGGGIEMIAEIIGTALTGRPAYPDPHKCVRADIPRKRREIAAHLLATGKVLDRCLGYADCRMCGVQLGCADLGGWGHLWPEKAEHYVLEHDVWVPGLDRLIERSGN